MDGGRAFAASRRLLNLAQKFRDKLYRDRYVDSHTRGVLAQQMRNFRGDLSQAGYAEKVNKQKTVIGRLENPSYGGWSLRTMLDIARRENVAVFVRFVDFPTFLRLTGDLSDSALRPASYEQGSVDQLANVEESHAQEEALKALFSPREDSISPLQASEGMQQQNASQPRAANDDFEQKHSPALSALG